MPHARTYETVVTATLAIAILAAIVRSEWSRRRNDQAVRAARHDDLRHLRGEIAAVRRDATERYDALSAAYQAAVIPSQPRNERHLKVARPKEC